ncbi:TPA: glycosyltransferase family protein [Bacillus cereus]|nr:glycosyltransferase family protein [Bacillus cereus]
MKVAAIIQARMDSSRFPGKILKKVLGKTLLEYQIERIKESKIINEIIIATTTKESDNQIVQLCQQLLVPYYRGPEEDVLSRYYEAATEFNIDVIVRLTSDCPIIDPNVINKVVGHYLENRNQYDYVSNTLKRTYPRGMDTEVMSYKALKRAYEESGELMYREHVTTYIYNHPNQFKLWNISNCKDESKHRWTVDTVEDFELIEKIISTLYPEDNFFHMSDVLNVINKNPTWFDINSHIEQKYV